MPPERLKKDEIEILVSNFNSLRATYGKKISGLLVHTQDNLYTHKSYANFSLVYELLFEKKSELLLGYNRTVFNSFSPKNDYFF